MPLLLAFISMASVSSLYAAPPIDTSIYPEEPRQWRTAPIEGFYRAQKPLHPRRETDPEKIQMQNKLHEVLGSIKAFVEQGDFSIEAIDARFGTQLVKDRPDWDYYSTTKINPPFTLNCREFDGARTSQVVATFSTDENARVVRSLSLYFSNSPHTSDWDIDQVLNGMNIEQPGWVVEYWGRTHKFGSTRSWTYLTADWKWRVFMSGPEFRSCRSLVVHLHKNQSKN